MSRVFSNGEIEALEKVKRGDRSDPTGVFYRFVKPKIKELLEVWQPQLKELERLIELKKKVKE